MNIHSFAKLIRQSEKTVRKRCSSGEIPAKKLQDKIWGGYGRWEIDEEYVNKLLTPTKKITLVMGDDEAYEVEVRDGH